MMALVMQLSGGNNTSILNTTFPSKQTTMDSSDEDLILSDAQRKLADEILLVFRYIAVTFAVPLTICNIVIFLQKEVHSAATVYVIGLSIAQLVYLLAATIHNIAYMTLNDPYSKLFYWVSQLYVSRFCGIVSKRGSYLVMSLVSLERLYAIVRPLHVKSFFLSRRPLLCVISAYVVTAVMHIYILAKLEIVSTENRSTGVVKYRTVLTKWYQQNKEINDFFGLMAKVLLTYCGLLLQICFNILTIFCLKRHNMKSKQMQFSTKEDEKRKKEKQMTVTILFTTIGYVILSLPAALLNLVITVTPRSFFLQGKYLNLYLVLNHIAFDLTVFSCGIDFVCFMVLSSSYRNAFFRIFLKDKTRRNTDWNVDENPT